MVSILHISDLHLTQNPNWNMMKRTILSYAEETFCDIPDAKKLLIVTGDFHNYMQDSYEPAKDFLRKLIQAMRIEPTEDVFVVPGNHDVSASSGNYDRSLLIRALKEEKDYRNKLNQDCDFRDYAMPKLLSCYDKYLQFVRDMKIYNSFSEELPVRVHVRTWQNRLHILHLNTALIASTDVVTENGQSFEKVGKSNQLVDALTATSDKVQDELHYGPDSGRHDKRSSLPCIAIGHNGYMDLGEQLREQSMKGAFFHGNISAYLCGDYNEKPSGPQDWLIHLDDFIEIPNVVALRDVADAMDNYSEFGMILHQWDEQTGKVKYTTMRWNPLDPGHIHPEQSREYLFRNYQPPK